MRIGLKEPTYGTSKSERCGMMGTIRSAAPASSKGCIEEKRVTAKTMRSFPAGDCFD